MSLPLPPKAGVMRRLRQFRRHKSGSAAVEFALVAPMFFAMLFALFETALMFFASQLLENGVQDSGRLIYTYQAQDSAISQSAFKTDLCNRVSQLFSCNDISVDVQSYPAGTTIPNNVPFDSSGNATAPMAWNAPPANSSSTVVIRAFYQWPLFVTQLGYNLANINRGATNSKRLLVATAALRVEPK